MSTTNLSLPTGGSVAVRTGIFINNEWRSSSSGESFNIYDPTNNQPLASISHASLQDVDDTVHSAKRAFQTTWGTQIPSSERARIMFKLADLMERDTEKLAALESLNTGKGIRIARGYDVPEAIACLRYYAGLADKTHGQVMDHLGPQALVYTMKQPYPICGQIIPWNYPIMMWAWKVSPALAAGCCVLVKPSELTPLTALALCDLAIEAGLPGGVLNTLPGLGSSTGEAITRHMGVDKISFTGSVSTGRRILVASAETNLKSVSLELGGKSPIIIFPNVDLEEASKWVAMGIWGNSGQDCTAGSRVYIHESVFDIFLEKMCARAKELIVGMPYDEKTNFGPLISKAQQTKVLDYISGAREEGARVVYGGTDRCEYPEGCWVLPTIITDVTTDMRVIKEEIFGPVLCIAPFSSEKQALTLANDSSVGLAAGIFTSDHSQAMRMSANLEAGTVWVNQYALTSNGAPFGGWKSSGWGKDLGMEGIEEYLRVKAVHHNFGSKA
ncbi:hypothetical protein M231_07496 [Tremella mesenterica]|uniref:Aldehyde dehydrogenase domain-containing protein n=2 Tax=Tremella mesenterica TaxID=5217 RepID=A0A4Q1B979_TREME|nr:hypothetical protein M231_07496 [Tremella mesenterica]